MTPSSRHASALSLTQVVSDTKARRPAVQFTNQRNAAAAAACSAATTALTVDGALPSFK